MCTVRGGCAAVKEAVQPKSSNKHTFIMNGIILLTAESTEKIIGVPAFLDSLDSNFFQQFTGRVRAWPTGRAFNVNRQISIYNSIFFGIFFAIFQKKLLPLHQLYWFTHHV